jgi:pyruvate dehydrogenase E1 component
MYEVGENIFYYITLMNENYVHPPMPDVPNIKEGILKGMYKFKASEKKNAKLNANLFGSGTILNEVIKAARVLEEKYNVASDVYSITSTRNCAATDSAWNVTTCSIPTTRKPLT